MENNTVFYGFVVLIIITIPIIANILKNPFQFPYNIISIDISNKRNVDYENEIDNVICQYRMTPFLSHHHLVQDWKRKNKRKANESILKPLRLKQCYSVLDEKNMFIFEFVRKQTRYKQSNYVKTVYKVDNVIHKTYSSFKAIETRYFELEKIEFQQTLKEYNSKNQRKLMTKELREQIKRRDNYTCQRCGKYMPDEVGLQIDHIIPVSKGGKSVPKNLQVLCSKCNGSKSNKM